MRLPSLLAVSIFVTGTLSSASELNPLNGHVDRTKWEQQPASTGPAQAGTNGIDYHNGPIMLGTTHIYYIWYGNWSTDAGANAILTNFANHIGGSPYFNINTSYTDGSSHAVSNAVTLAGSTTDTNAKTALADADIWTIVTRAIGNGMAVDPNGVYFVLTAPGVTETSGFLSRYCGWHTYNVYNGIAIKYSFVGDAKGASLGACAAQTSQSPNGDPPADAMVSVVVHELQEAVTDPQLNAWYDNSSGQESADKCAWNFGTTYSTGNGSFANVKLGTFDFLIQRQWLNANGGSCALTYAGAPSSNFSLTVSPASQSVTQGGITPNYAITVNKTGNFSSTVNFQVAGLPAGATLKTAPAASASSATFSINVPATVGAGSYAFTVTGVSGSLTHSVSATLVVTPSGFTLAAAPASQTVVQGGAASNYTVTVTRLGTFASAVNFQVSGLPAGAALKTAPAASGVSTVFSVNVPMAVAVGVYPLTITGTSGALTRTTSATLNVTSANLFSVTLTPATYTVSPGAAAHYIVNVTSLKPSTSPVILSVRGLPTGATVSFSKPNITGTGTSTLTINTTTSTPKTTTNFTVTGSIGNVTSSANASLVVH